MACACNSASKSSGSTFKLQLKSGSTKTYKTQMERDAAAARNPGSKKI